jgi:hypothetical protein
MRRNLLYGKFTAVLLIFSLFAAFFLPYAESDGEGSSGGINGRQCSSYADPYKLAGPAGTDKILPGDNSFIRLRNAASGLCRLRLLGLWCRNVPRLFASVFVLYSVLWLFCLSFIPVGMIIIRYIHSKDGRKDAALFCLDLDNTKQNGGHKNEHYGYNCSVRCYRACYGCN